MVNEALRRELLVLRAEDLRVREERMAVNELGGKYHPRREAVHVNHAAQLGKLVTAHGWPAADIAGVDGREAAWLIARHSLGEPEFLRKALELQQGCVTQQGVPGWHAAHLEDRIALYEGRPQRWGTHSIDDPGDGVPRPSTIADPRHLHELRATVGPKPLGPVPPSGPGLPKKVREENESTQKWWLEWLASRSWHKA